MAQPGHVQRMFLRFAGLDKNIIAYHEAGHAVVGLANGFPLWNEGIVIQENVGGETWAESVNDAELSVTLALPPERRRHIKEIELRMAGIATESAYKLGNWITDDDIQFLAECFVGIGELDDDQKDEAEDLHRAFITMNIVYRQTRFGIQDDVVMPKDKWEFADLISKTVNTAYESAKVKVLEHETILKEFVEILLAHGQVDAEYGNDAWKTYQIANR